MEELKKYLVNFEIADNKERYQYADSSEETFAESEEEAVELVRQWVIDTCAQDGYTIDLENVGSMDGIRIIGDEYLNDIDVEYRYFRVVERD